MFTTSLFSGAIISILADVLNFFSKKFGREMTSKAIISLVIVASLVAAFLQHQGILTQEFLVQAGEIMTIASGFYELVLKRVVRPAFEKTRDGVSRLKGKVFG